jgi:hypothetical protein
MEGGADGSAVRILSGKPKLSVLTALNFSISFIGIKRIGHEKPGKSSMPWRRPACLSESSP